MCFKLVCAFFAISIVSQRLSVESLDLRVLGMTNAVINERIASRIPDEAADYMTTSCGGVLTRAPGAIRQRFRIRERTTVECTWKIQAPADHSVYIRKFETQATSLPGRPLGDPKADSVDLQIYEGNGSAAKRCFRSKSDSALDKCISDGRTMTVVLNYEESGLLAEHEVTLEYGFTERSEISDLLN